MQHARSPDTRGFSSLSLSQTSQHGTRGSGTAATRRNTTSERRAPHLYGTRSRSSCSLEALSYSSVPYATVRTRSGGACRPSRDTPAHRTQTPAHCKSYCPGASPPAAAAAPNCPRQHRTGPSSPQLRFSTPPVPAPQTATESPPSASPRAARPDLRRHPRERAPARRQCRPAHCERHGHARLGRGRATELLQQRIVLRRAQPLVAHLQGSRAACTRAVAERAPLRAAQSPARAAASPWAAVPPSRHMTCVLRDKGVERPRMTASTNATT
jgi:hypothetical protein